MTKEEIRLAKIAKLANIILGGEGAVCLLVLSYFIYYYSWTGERQFISWMGPVVYYILPAVLTTLLFASLQLRPAYKVNLALVCFSIGVSTYAGELFLIFWSSTSSATPLWADDIENQKKKAEIVKLAKKFGANFDTRSRLEVVTDLRKKGIDAVPSIIPLGLLKKREDESTKSKISIDGTEVLPLSGLANKVTVLCNETGEYTIYESDEHGFHNPRGIWKSNRVDIAALGDSFTQGFCVPSAKNFVALIRKHYPATLNLGMAGEGPFLELAALKEYLPLVKPKVVLWFYFENDPVDLMTEKTSRLLLRYIEDDFNQGLLTRQSDINQALRDYIGRERARETSRVRKGSENKGEMLADVNKLLKIIKLGSLREKLGLILGIEENASSELTAEENMALFRKILLEAKASVSGWGGTLYFVYLPTWERYGNPKLARKYSRYREPVLTLVRSLGIPIIDIVPAFQAQSDPLSLFPFRRFGHYNEEGHRVVAEEVLRNISLEREMARSEVNTELE